MPLFKAPLLRDGEFFYIQAHTWFDARNIARRLYPLESMEMLWTKMEMLDSSMGPLPGSDVFELLEGEVQQARGYEKGVHKEITRRLKGKR